MIEFREWRNQVWISLVALPRKDPDEAVSLLSRQNPYLGLRRNCCAFGVGGDANTTPLAVVTPTVVRAANAIPFHPTLTKARAAVGAAVDQCMSSARFVSEQHVPLIQQAQRDGFGLQGLAVFHRIPEVLQTSRHGSSTDFEPS